MRVVIEAENLPRTSNTCLALAIEHLVEGAKQLQLASLFRRDALRHGHDFPDNIPEVAYLDITNPNSGLCELIRKCVGSHDTENPNQTFVITGTEEFLTEVNF